MKYLLPLLFSLLLSGAALAVEPDEIMQDPLLEARAREISKTLRCMVCRGEDIDESQAPLAADLRRLVRERLGAGDNDRQVTAYIQERYGDEVLFSPPMQLKTLLLWGSPFLVIVAGGAMVLRLSRRKKD